MTKPPPSVFLALLFVVLLGIFAIAAGAALRLPNLGIDVDLGPQGQLLVVSIEDPSQPIALPATLMSVSSAQLPGQRIVVENDHHLIVETQTAPKKSSILAQDALWAMAAQGSLILELRDARGQNISIERATTGYQGLTLRFWMLALAGLTCGLVSAWVFILRPDIVAAQAILLIGLSLVGVTLPIAVTFAGDFIVGGVFWLLAQVSNHISTQIFAVGLVVLLLQYPRKIVNITTLCWTAAAIFLPLVFLVLNWRDPIACFDFMNIVVPLDLLLIIAVAVFQWRATKLDPVGRAYIRLVGATWVIVLTLWVAIFVVPVFLGGVPLLDFSVGMWLLVPPFFAMAYGVGKGFMFEASTWAGRLLLSATTLLVLIGVDVGLVYAAGLSSTTAASGAFCIVGAIWFLARNALASRFLVKDIGDNTGLFDQAVGVAMARDDAERAAKWQAALKANFEPLDMAIQSPQSLQMGVIGGGLALSVPALRFAPPLLLTSKRAGTQVFTKADVKMVDTLKAMCERIDSDRDAYERGTQSERGRIARDLHDDVSSRLLTSLHRGQPDRMQADVREALSDIRSIVSGLDGGRQEFDDVMSAIRIEALDRFEAANISATWPLDSVAQPTTIALDYRMYRNVSAVLREIVSNIIRHANATQVTIATQLIIDQNRQVCHISICDNGVGLALEHKKGNGLTNIVSRMAEIGGNVTFSNAAFSVAAFSVAAFSVAAFSVATGPDEPKGLCIKLEWPLAPLK